MTSSMPRLSSLGRKTVRNARRRLLSVQQLEDRNLLAAQPIISEFVASNNSSFSDGFGGDPDWIELTNVGDMSVDLEGYYLTDDASDPFKWQFSSSTILNPNEYLVVFASDLNTIDPAGYWHTSFKLDADGEQVALADPNGVILSQFGAGSSDYPSQLTDVSYGVSGSALVTENSVAEYWIPTNNDVDGSWTQTSFDAVTEGFSLDRASFGYENNPSSSTSYSTIYQTSVPSGTISLYARTHFQIADASQITGLNLNLKFDDGFLAYLNGTLVASHNAPASPAYNSVATTEHPDVNAVASVDYDLTSFVSSLQDGDNVLAIHALNRSSGSSDFLMVPTLTAEGAGVGESGFLLAPTPGGSNSGTRDVGPLITDVTPDATSLSPGQSLTVTATVSDFLTALDTTSVRLHYRVMFGPEVTLTMLDNGLGPDAVAGDDVFTAQIPSSAYSAGELVRWYVTAEDVFDVASRAPQFFDPIDSPEYYGTVVADASITSDLPVMQWFVEDPEAAKTAVGTRGSLYYRGQYYDNIQMDLHGQSTAGPEFIKKSYDFDANSGHKFDVGDGLPKVSDFNLLTNYGDQSKLRNTLGYEAFEATGSAHHLAHPIMIYQNDQFFGLYDFVEEGDSEYLDRLGLNPDNPLYKVNNNLTSTTQEVEKKSRKWEDFSDLQEVIDAEALTGNAADRWDYDNWHIAELVNYLAVQNVTGNSDFGHKNMYLYRDTEGTGLWYILPWDVDLSHGHRWNGNLSSPYFDNALITNSPLYAGWNDIIQRLMVQDSRFNEMYLRRVRTLMDQFYGAPGTSTANSWLAGQINSWEALIADEAIQNANEWGLHPNFSQSYPFNASQAADQIRDSFIASRRSYLEGISAIPNPQVGNPSINIHQTDYDAGLETDEYIRLDNPNGVAVDISGWQLTGGVNHVFSPGTVIPSNSTLYVVGDVVGFKNRTSGPSGGQELFIQGNYQGTISSQGETITLQAADNTTMSMLVVPPSAAPNQDYLRVTEINYNPPGGSDTTEFIELTNISSGAESTVLDLTGVVISEGPDTPFQFTAGTQLLPGASLVVVRDQVAFQAMYPTVSALAIAGEFTGGLDNGGGTIRVDDFDGTRLVEIDYNDSDPWSKIADGAGGSLELIDASGTPREQLDKYYSWRGSRLAGGTPAAANVDPFAVVINEILSHTDAPLVDAIELFNTGTNSVNIGGWFLSDGDDNLFKYEIPAGTILPAGGFMVFDESHFNPTPLTPGPNDFALNSSEGDEVWLTIRFGNELAAFVDQVEFNATFNGESFGRSPNGIGRLQPMAGRTLGAANTVIRQAGLVVSEVNFNPAVNPSAPVGTTSGDLEYVEVHNFTDASIDLTEWRLRGEVDYDFAPGTAIAAGQTWLIVSFDPTDQQAKDAFVANYGLSGSEVMVGPFSGGLSNNFARVEIDRPDASPPDDPTFVPHVTEDELIYDDLWAASADGGGDSLHRVNGYWPGIMESNWVGQAPTPGTASFASGIVGDYNRDGVVDSLDQEVWKISFGSTLASNADGNGNGTIDAADYTVWRDSVTENGFVATGSPTSTSSVRAAGATASAYALATTESATPRAALAAASILLDDAGIEGPYRRFGIAPLPAESDLERAVDVRGDVSDEHTAKAATNEPPSVDFELPARANGPTSHPPAYSQFQLASRSANADSSEDSNQVHDLWSDSDDWWRHI